MVQRARENRTGENPLVNAHDRHVSRGFPEKGHRLFPGVVDDQLAQERFLVVGQFDKLNMGLPQGHEIMGAGSNLKIVDGFSLEGNLIGKIRRVGDHDAHVEKIDRTVFIIVITEGQAAVADIDHLSQFIRIFAENGVGAILG